MRDEMNHNTLAITGTPSLVTGALTIDTDQALGFNGTTNSAAATDSVSLSITGSFSIECFVRLTSYPGSTQNLVVKTSSYSIQVDSTGHILFNVANGAVSGGVVSNVALSLNRWYHIICVYNGNYSGGNQFGAILEPASLQVDDTNGNNKAVTKFTLAEPGLLSAANVSLKYVDEIWQVDMCAVVYQDASGVPGPLVTTSAVRQLTPPTPQWRVYTWVNFPLTPAVVPAGTYWAGYVSDTVSDSLPKSVLVVGDQTSGGATARRNDSVTGPSDPFGTAVVSADIMAVYCDYTAIGRTGREGKMLVYIDGSLNVSIPYSGGVADTANSLQVCTALAAQVDELSVWNYALSDVQIANHYNAH